MPGSPGLWRDHDFVRLWSAQATGLVGQQFSVLAMPLVAILTLHAGASTVGLFVGGVIDRFPRRSVLILSDLGRPLLLAAGTSRRRRAREGGAELVRLGAGGWLAFPESWSRAASTWET